MGSIKGSDASAVQSMYVIFQRGPVDYIEKLYVNSTLWLSFDGTTFTPPTDGQGNPNFVNWNVLAGSGASPWDYAYQHTPYGSWNGSIRLYYGTPNQPIDAIISGGIAAGPAYPTAYRWRVGVAFENANWIEQGSSTPNVTIQGYRSVTALSDIVTTISGMVSVAAGKLDVATLAGVTLYGFKIDSRRAASEALKQLMTAYQFTLPEVDGVVRAVKRGQTSIASLAASDLRWHDAGNAAPNTEFDTVNPDSIPDRVDVRYTSQGRNLFEGLVGDEFSVPASTNKVEINIAGVAMTDGSAQQLANYILGIEKDKRTKIKLNLGAGYSWLAPSDVVTIYTPDGGRDILLQKQTAPMPRGPIAAEAINYDSGVWSAPLGGGTSGAPPLAVDFSNGVLYAAFEMNAPITGPTGGLDMGFVSGPGIWLASSVPDGNPALPPTIVNGQYQNGQANPNWTYWTNEYFTGSEGIKGAAGNGSNPRCMSGATMGFTDLSGDGLLGNFEPTAGDILSGDRQFDDVNTVTVLLLRGKLPPSTPDSALINAGANGFYLNGEIIQFGTAIYNGEVTAGDVPWTTGDQLYTLHSYTLSHLLRGRCGTDNWIGQHNEGDLFILLNALVEFASLNPAVLRLQDTGTTISFTVNQRSSGPGITLTATTPFVYRGYNVYPFAPVLLPAVRAGGNTTINWAPRSKARTAQSEWGFWQIDDAPGDRRVVQVTVMNATPPRKLAPTSAGSVVYTAAEQTADRLIPGAHLQLQAQEFSTILGAYGYGLGGGVVAGVPGVASPWPTV